MPESVANQLADKAIEYQINLLRVEAGMRQKTLAALQDLEGEIIGTLEKNKTLGPGKKKQLKKVLDATQGQVEGIYAQINQAGAKDLEKIAVASNDQLAASMSGAIQVDMGAMRLTPKQLENIVKGPVLEGNPIEDWWKKQASDLTTAIHGEVQKGMFLGEGVDDLARRIRGTKANNYQDGLMQVKKHQAEAIVRSAVQSVNNQAGIEGIVGAGEAVKGIEWVATLDTRTTPTCRALDGKQWTKDFEPVEHDMRFPGPIAHWGCRSTQIAVTRTWSELSGKKLNEGTDSQTFRENFEKRLADKGFTPEQIELAGANQRAAMDGQTSATQDFDKWARNKGDAFVEGLLGPGRYRLWKQDKLSFRDLVDQTGRPLTIEQLQASVESGKLPAETEGLGFEFTSYTKPELQVAMPTAPDPALAIEALDALPAELEKWKHFKNTPGDEIELKAVGFKGGGEHAKGGAGPPEAQDFKWATVELDLAQMDVHNIQGSVLREGVRKKLEDGVMSDPKGLPIAFFDPDSGKYTLIDGNHRAVSQALLYDGRIKVRVIERTGAPGKKKTWTEHAQPDLAGGLRIGQPELATPIAANSSPPPIESYHAIGKKAAKALSDEFVEQQGVGENDAFTESQKFINAALQQAEKQHLRVTRDANGQITGAISWQDPEAGGTSITFLGATEAGEGTGTRLIDQAIDYAIAKGGPLEVFSTDGSDSYYKHLGFKKAGKEFAPSHFKMEGPQLTALGLNIKAKLNTQAPQPGKITLYHGGTSKSKLYPRTFLTTDTAIAAEYATSGSAANPTVQAFAVTMDNPATQEDVKATAIKLGIDLEALTGIEAEYSLGFEYMTDDLIGAEHAKAIQADLEAQGFDGVHFVDDFTPMSGQPIPGGSWLIFEADQAVPIAANPSQDAANATAALKLADYQANPKGQTLKTKWAKKVLASDPDLSPSEQLAKVDASAAAEQAEKSKSSKLSTAKKKLLADPSMSVADLSPSLKAQIDALEPDELQAFSKTVQDEKTAKQKDIGNQVLAAIVQQPTTGGQPPEITPATQKLIDQLPEATKETMADIHADQVKKWETATVDDIKDQLSEQYLESEQPAMTNAQFAQWEKLSTGGKADVTTAINDYGAAYEATQIKSQVLNGDITPATGLEQLTELAGHGHAHHIVKNAKEAVEVYDTKLKKSAQDAETKAAKSAIEGATVFTSEPAPPPRPAEDPNVVFENAQDAAGQLLAKIGKHPNADDPAYTEATDQIHEAIYGPGDKTIVKNFDGQIAAVVSVYDDGNTLHVMHIGSLEPGAGTEAMSAVYDKAINHQKDVSLNSTPEAVDFYKKLGMEPGSKNGQGHTNFTITAQQAEIVQASLKAQAGLVDPINLTTFDKAEGLYKIAGDSGDDKTQLKAKAFKAVTGVDPKGLSGLDMAKHIPQGMSYTETVLKIETIAAEKQAAASLASKLSTAKKKIVAGKPPTKSQQAAIDSLTPQAKAAWQTQVDDAVGAASAGPGMKLVGPPTSLDTEAGLEALAKLKPIEGSEYEVWVDYLPQEELDALVVNPLQIIELDADVEAAQDLIILPDSESGKTQNAITSVAIGDLKTMQPFVEGEFVAKYLASGDLASINPTHQGDPPKVVKLNGNLHLIDGNHRASAFMLAGETHMDVLLYDLDAEAGDSQAKTPPIYNEIELAKFKTKQAFAIEYAKQIGHDDFEPKNIGLTTSGEPPAGVTKTQQELFSALYHGGEVTVINDQHGDVVGAIALENFAGQIIVAEIASTEQGGTPQLLKIAVEKAIATDQPLALDPGKAGVELYAKMGFTKGGGAGSDFYTEGDALKKVLADIDAGQAGEASKAAAADAAVVAAYKATTKTATEADIDAKNLDLYVPTPDKLLTVEILPGSTKPAKMIDDATGKHWVLKNALGGGGKKHLASEATADAIYREMGARVPGSKYSPDDGTYGPTKIAEFVEGATELGKWEAGKTAKQKQAVYDQLQDHFVLDSLLGNWDVAGQTGDNILVKDGKPIRIDNGGALSFRAQGEKKTKGQWSPTVSELDTLRDSGQAAGNTAAIFQGITEGQIHDQIVDIVQRKDEILAIAKQTETQATVNTLKRRIADLESRLPDSRKAEANKNAKAAKSKAIANITDPAAVAKAAEKARINGYALPIGTGDVEDMQALVWQMTTKEGKPETKITLKMTDDGAGKFNRSLPQAQSDPGKHPDDQNYHEPLLAMVKTMATHHGDGKYTQGTISTFVDQLGKVQEAHEVEAGKTLKNQDPAKMAMLESYLASYEATSEAYGKTIHGDPTMPPQVRDQEWRYDPSDWGQGDSAPRDYTIVQGREVMKFPGMKITDGHARMTGDMANRIPVNAKNYIVTFADGATATVIDRQAGTNHRTGLALEGTITLTVPGYASEATIQDAVAKLEQLGLDTTPPDADYNEWVWLSKTAHVHGRTHHPVWQDIVHEPDMKSRIRQARMELTKITNSIVPSRGDPGYTADGVANSFGDGTRHVWRTDMPREKADQEMEGYTLRHTTRKKLEDVLTGFLDSGGEATPTIDRVRKGVALHETGGESADADLVTGGAAYFFTRIRPDTDTTPGFFFKVGNVGRADAISYTVDNYGSVDDLDDRTKTVESWKKMAEREGRDETIFKRGMLLVDELDYIQTYTVGQRKALIAIFKDHGITKLTDGRKITDVVRYEQ